RRRRVARGAGQRSAGRRLLADHRSGARRPWHALLRRPGKDLRLTEPLESALLDRLREVLRNESATEGELRTLGEQADGWARVLHAQIHAGEQRLQRLTGDPA